MVKRDANIDILFRDGLSNMEVLPPADVWDSIEPVVRRKRWIATTLRAAASLAAVVALGITAYLLGVREVSSFDQPLSSVIQPVFTNAPVQSETADPFTHGIQAAGSAEAVAVIGQETESPVEELQTSKMAQASDIMLSFRDIDTDLDINDTSPGILEPYQETGNFDTGSELASIPEQEPAADGRWRIGARVSPTYLASNLLASNDQVSDLQGRESSVISYTGGISLSYRMSGRLSLHTGVYYSSLGREINGINSFSGFSPYSGSKSGTIFEVATSTGTISSTNDNIFLYDNSGSRIEGIYTSDNFDPVKANLSPFGNRLRQNFEYIEIPFMLSYQLIDRKIGFNLLGGMSYNFLVNNQAWAVSGESRIPVGTTDGMDGMFLSSALGLSMEYNLSQRFSLNFEPSFRYYLNTGNWFTLGNPYTIGVFSGLTYKF